MTCMQAHLGAACLSCSSCGRHALQMAAKPIVAGAQVAWQDVCQSALQAPVTSVTATRIGSLWGRYGSVTEVTAETASGAVQVIAKQVDPPRGQGGVGDQRKLNSYKVEAAFYKHYAARVLESGVCAISRPLLIDAAPPHFFFLLSDLRPAFPRELGSYDAQDAAAALDWLAGFHALWWEQVPGQTHPVSSSSSSDGGCLEGLWQQGCYWHLDTRQEELRSMSEGWRELRAAAPQLDEVLKGLRADGSKTQRHRTLVHGDFKSANLLFDEAGACCAAFDFQYTGDGLGVQDIAYMFVSSLDEDVLEQQEQQLLRHYWDQLQAHLRRMDKQAAAEAYSFEALQAQFDVAVADYVRFMAGWGLWGNTSWARQRTKQVLQRLLDVTKVARAQW